MAKTKTLDQLRAEKEQAEAQLLQEQHKLQRLEQRKKHYEKGERKKRTHRLCNLGGTIELVGLEEDAWILSCESLDLVVELCTGDVHQFRYLVDIQFRVG